MQPIYKANSFILTVQGNKKKYIKPMGYWAIMICKSPILIIKKNT